MNKKKKQVLEFAIKLFSEYGYGQIGVDRICEEANVSKMTAYKYFPTKELLFEAALAERNNIFIQDIISAISQYEDPTDKLKSIFIYYHNWFNQDDFTGCLFINSVSLVENNNNCLKFIKQNKSMMQQLIESILCFFISDDITKIAKQIIKLLDGAVISAQIGFEKEPAYNAWEAVIALLKNRGVDIESGNF